MALNTTTFSVLANSPEMAAQVALECAAEGTRPVRNSTSRRTQSDPLPGAEIVSVRPEAQTGSAKRAAAMRAAIERGEFVVYTVELRYDFDAAVAAFVARHEARKAAAE